MESEARLVMVDGGLPPPVLQYEIVARWPEAFLRDRRRGAALLDLGWVVVPIVAGDVRYRQGELVHRIAMRLERGRAA